MDDLTRRTILAVRAGPQAGQPPLGGGPHRVRQSAPQRWPLRFSCSQRQTRSLRCSSGVEAGSKLRRRCCGQRCHQAQARRRL
jgi:hypothetical protein